MSTSERAAGWNNISGLEALQREWRNPRYKYTASDGNVYELPYDHDMQTGRESCAEALAPHIAAAKEREERVATLERLLREGIGVHPLNPSCKVVDRIDALAWLQAAQNFLGPEPSEAGGK